MTSNNINIQSAISYITSNEVVYQKAYSLIDVSNQDTPEQQKEIIDLLSNHDDNVQFIVRENLFGTPFEDLAQLSTEKDALILVGDEALICIPNKDAKLICK